ncbi:unnamed protein product [Ophioblennius macclurei]
MAFFRQLKLLLWKNGLGVIRQPVWSLTLIIWPLIIFIIVTVTRNQFPPVLRETCYVGPRNLPSAGFFPFLQTLMCNTDSSCHNKSRLVERSTSRPSRDRRSLKNSPLVNLIEEGDFLKLSYDAESRRNTEELIRFLENILGSSNQGRSKETSSTSTRNSTFVIHHESLEYLQDMMNLLKRAICTLILPTMNTTSPNALTSTAVKFCQTNNSLFEVSLYTLNQILTEQMLTEPDEILSVAGVGVMLFNQMQNETVLWESLLAFPQFFFSGSEGELLSSTDALLTHIQSALRVIQDSFPETGTPLSSVQTLLAAGINLVRYVQNWPGRGVSIPLGDLVTLNNDTLSEVLQQALQGIQIPLDKAIPLTLDKDMVESYLCENSSNSIWLTAACRTGTVNMLMSMVNPDKVARKVLLYWSRHVAPHDVAFVKGLVYSLIKDLPAEAPEGSSTTRTQRSTDTQPENIEEELFLNVGSAVIDLSTTVPELYTFLQSILRSGFQSMKTATLVLDFVEEILNSVQMDASHLHQTIHTLLTDESRSKIWFDRVLNSLMETIMKGISSGSLTCKEFVDPFEWLLPTETVKLEVWQAMICQNDTRLEQTLLLYWETLVEQALALNSTLTGEAEFSVGLPTILSEWHQFNNSSARFANFVRQLPPSLYEEYWMNTIPENSTYDMAETLQERIVAFLINLGVKIENSHLWPEVKNYFHMAYWILNYKPEVTTEPANCSADVNLTIHCDTGFSWPEFVRIMTQELMSQRPDAMVNSLKGAVNLLMHVYGNTSKELASMFLKQEIKGGDALSEYLINWINELDEFVRRIATLSDENIDNPNVMGPLVSSLFKSTGLGPLLPVLMSGSPLNGSAVLHVASQLGRLNQHIFTFNESDPAMPELERLILEFLSSDSSLTIPVSHIMGHSLLTYVADIPPEKLAHVKAALQPFTNQTSAGLVETILNAAELLDTLTSPNTSVDDAVLLYIQEIQKFVISLFRLQKIDQLLLPNGQLSNTQVTDLSSGVMDFLHLFTPEGLHNLSQIGPDAAQNLVIMKFVAILPPEVRENVTYFLHDLKKLQHQVTNCTEDQNCLVGISEIVTVLDQVLNMMNSTNGNGSIAVTQLNFTMGSEENKETLSAVLSFLMPSNVESVRQVLNFIDLVLMTPDITVTSLQNALVQSGLTIQELTMFVEQIGATDMGDLLVNMLGVVNVQQCFQPQPDPMVTAHCVTELVNRFSGFLMQVIEPSSKGLSTIISFIPQIVNKTISDILQVDFSSSPNRILAQTMNSTLFNIKTVLHQNKLNSSEIMQEFRMVEGLIHLIGSIETNQAFNATLMEDAVYAQTVYLQLVDFYLKKLENITRNSSVSEFLQPILHIAQMEVTMQLSQMNLSIFISNKIEYLIENIQHPVDGEGFRMIGLTSIEIVDRIWDSTTSSLEYQNMMQGYQVFNQTILSSVEQQFKLYLALIRQWMKQPDVPLVLTNTLQWGNSSIPFPARLTDIQDWLKTLPMFLSGDQQAYLSIVNNITQSLTEAVTLAESGGLQSEAFAANVLTAVQSTMHLVTAAAGPLPVPVQETVLEIVRDSLSLIVHPDMSFASSRNISLNILRRVEVLLAHITPPEDADNLLPVINLITMYFETISEGGGPDKWNELILNEMQTLLSFLPPNSTAHYYISTLMNTTSFILESGQGSLSLWESFQNASGGDWTEMIGQAIMMAEKTGALQSEPFSAVILEIVSTFMDLLAPDLGPVPHPVQQNILGIVGDSLSLILHPNMSFTSSRNISLDILQRVEALFGHVLPREVAEYLVPVIKVISTYFETISEGGGPDKWNELILSEMMTIQNFLPPNSTAEYYISTLIHITNFILESGQGNTSMWASLENASEENLPEVIGQIGKLFGMIWPLVTGGTGSHSTPASLEAFNHLGQVLEQMMTGSADKDTWDKFGKMLEPILWMLKSTDQWDNVRYDIAVTEIVVKSLVKTTIAENEMIKSLQLPLVTLIREMAQSVNGSDFDLALVSEKMQGAIENTVKAAQQGNGTLECSVALVVWEPVTQAAGLSKESMTMWCEIRLKPVWEAYAAAETVYSSLNMSHVDEGPTSVNATADRIVEIARCLYEADVNQTLLMEQLFMTLYGQISSLADNPLSPEAEQHFYDSLQNMQLQNSLSSINELFDELLVHEPYLKPYTDCLVSSLGHVLKEENLAGNGSSMQDPFEEATLGFFSCINITSHDMSMMWGNVSGFDEASLEEAMRDVIKLMTDMKVFGDDPDVLQLLESNEANAIIEEVAAMVAWLFSTEESGAELLRLALPKISEIIRPAMSLLTKMTEPENAELIEGLVENTYAMLSQLLRTGGFLPPMDHPHGSSMSEKGDNRYLKRVRQRRDVEMMTMREPMDDFIDLFNINYPAMFKALAVVPSTEEILETAHGFFANPDLRFVINEVMSDLQPGWNSTAEQTVDATLGVFSYLTIPHLFDTSSLHLLANAINMLPVGFPFSADIKQFTNALANESPENLMLMQRTFQTMVALFHISPSDPLFKEQFENLISQECELESLESVSLLMGSLSIEPGQLCRSILPGLQTLIESLLMDPSTLSDVIFQAVIGDPQKYQVHANWSAVLTQNLDLDMNSLRSLRVNITSPGTVTVGEMLRNKNAFVQDVERYMVIDPGTLNLLMESTLPNSNLEILSWFTKLRHCNSTAPEKARRADAVIFDAFCSMSVQQWYRVSLLMARHVNLEKLIYRMVLSEESQTLVGVMLQMAEVVTETMTKILPAVSQLQSYLRSIDELNLVADSDFSQMSRAQRTSASSPASFVTLSRALCSNGILALFGISQLPAKSESDPSFLDSPEREEMIERFKLPRDATPFCMNMYLDMVNTTGGAIAWAFLKPMLMGQILYTPDTPTTRDIMEKANATLQEFADLRQHSQEWLDSSSYIVKSAEMLGHTLPMLQNSLGNSFVKNFIEMQTDINVDRMKETLSTFSNLTLLLEKNKNILNQISTLSSLMVDLSSCIKFDRYSGYDSAEQLNAEAQELAKNRDLYASVIFKLPEDEDASRYRKARSSSSTLPPKVSYTIRMHMDNVMRTDRVRNPYYVKESHISARLTMRYNRGFIYLQENIDRAIIETHAGHKVTDPAVQIQPFPYPCHFRDEYLEGISFVFPLMLMIAWVLFVADFVKKLVHERELRLHEYMKMMGVNPFSHFFAWFLQCTFYLVPTIFILTMLLKYGKILPHSDAFLIFLYFCDYGLSIIAFSYLVSSFFDKTYIAGLSGSLLYILCFFPFIVVMAVEKSLTFTQKSLLSLFSPTCFSYASQYASRYEAQGEGIQWDNAYTSPIAEDTSSFGWLCWLMLIDSILYFIIGGYIRMVFPGKYGIPAPWYFPFQRSYWADLCCCFRSQSNTSKGLFFSNIMQNNQPVFPDDKGKSQSSLSSQAVEDFSDLPVGVALHGLTKLYDNQAAIENLNISFYEGHVTSLLGHNGAGKTTTMSLLTGLFAPSSGSIEVYGRDMQTNIDKIRKELGVCMQYDVLFDHMTAKEHLLLYGQIKAPHWSRGQLHEQVRTILEETGMHAHRHKRVGTLSGGMKRKLSISIAFIGGSRLVVLDEPTTGVDPCSRRSIWDIVIQHKKHRTIIMSTHHLDEAEVLSDRIAFLERGGLKCCGSPFYLKDKLGQGYKLTLTKKMQNSESQRIDDAELKSFIQTHVPEARLKDAQGGDLVYSLPPFTSSNASAYRSLLTALDSNLDALQLGGYGISDTTLEEVFLQLTHNADGEDAPLSVSETVSDSASIDSFPSDLSESVANFGDKINLTSSSTVSGVALAWQQMTAILIKRFHHSRRDWKGLISQLLLPVVFVVFAMGLGSIKSDLQHYPELELSPALYKVGPSYSFFSNQNPSSDHLVNRMMSFPGIDNSCLDKSNNKVCSRNTNNWISTGNRSQAFSECKCARREQICDARSFQPPHRRVPSSQVIYNLSGINVERYLVATANDFIRNRYGGFAFGSPLPPDLQMDVKTVPKNHTLSKVWFNPEGHHTMPAYLNSLNNLILRSNLPADKDPRKYAISVSSQPYFGRADDEDAVVQGMLQILVAMCVLTGYSIMTASFAIYEVNEHHSGSKRLQHIAGISEPFYWTVNFIYDMAIYMIPVILTIAVIAAFQIPAFTYRQNLGAVTLLLVLFGFSTFPWMYLLSGVFKDAEMAFITFVCINLFVSINTIISTSILHFVSQIAMHHPEEIQAIFKKLCHAFLIFPQFNFGNGLLELARMNINVQLLMGYGVDAYKDPFSTDALGWMYISSFIQGVFFFGLRLLLSKSFIRKVRRLICGRKTLPQVPYEDQDEDVATEHLRVSSGAASSDVLQVNQLTKVYQQFKRRIPAVKKLSVGIPAGECFGLLGVNGAGKTTTFKMLTGDISPSEGTAQIRDWEGRLVDIMECRNQGINIGYCPQLDALDHLLTGEEHLYFYARIRGISKKQIRGVVNYLLKRLELDYHRNIITDGYSCGTRRKLSTALALVGHPQILLLDEPSSGMDPRTKRHLWKIITEEVKGKCAVVLTSHSMEECEALCTRLAIMVKGQFQCLGSLQHIKNRFGSGFTVKMYLAEASCDAEAITGFMQGRFPTTYLKDQHSAMVEYHVPFAPGGVADIFDQLESNKNALRIKHFSVSQTTLDEVFINFAMGKIGMKTVPFDSEDEEDDPDAMKSVQT